MEGTYDLLRNPINSCWAVNCLVEEDTVHIGAFYLEPNIPTPNIRLTHNKEHITVQLPDEYLRQGQSLRAWNIELPRIQETT